MNFKRFPELFATLSVVTLFAGCSKPRGPQITMADVELTNAPVSANLVRFEARPGSKMAIEGTANMFHTRWFVESTIIGGFVEAGANFPIDPAQVVTPGKVTAKAEAFLPVRSLKSVENGKPYSDKMDDIMYEKLLATDDPRARITFRLTELVLKEPAKSADAPHLFDAKGELTVAGVTNSVQFNVGVVLMPDKKLKITGNTAVKMTDYKITPPAPTVLGGLLKTGDEVKLSFEWLVGQKPPPAASTATAQPTTALGK